MIKELYMWGNNNPNLSNLIGDYLQNPTQIGSDSNWDDIDAILEQGIRAIFAIKDGNLYGWLDEGSVSQDYLFDNTYTEDYLTPTPIFTDHTNWKQITCGGTVVLGIKNNGTLWAWGSNGDYETGQGTSSGNTYEPTQIGTDTDWAIVKSTKAGASIALKEDGTLWSWGWNNAGQTGQNTSTDFTTLPTQIGTDTDWLNFDTSTININNPFILAVKTDGTLWSWGSNIDYQTGLNTNSGNTLVPTQIGTGSDWFNPTAGPRCGFCVKTDGTLWSWGSNWGFRNGQTPITSTDYTTIPAQIGTESNWKVVTKKFVGFGHVSSDSIYATFALKTNHTLWTWGANKDWQTTQNPSTQYLTDITQIGTLNNWSEIILNSYKFSGTGSAWVLGITSSPPIPPNLSNAELTISRENNVALIKENEQSEWLPGANFGKPTGTASYQWQQSNNLKTWTNIYGENNSELILENDYDQKYIRLLVEIENEVGLDQIYSNHIYIDPPYDQISLIEKLPPWKFILYDYQGQAIGELIDMHNINLNLSLNQNPTLSFDTTLKSPLGQIIGNGLDPDNPLFFITAWRFDPYETNDNDKYKLLFSGIIFSTEERGEDNNPTIGVTAVGGYYQLTKRIANDAKNNGRRQSGIKPTNDSLRLYVTDNGNNRIMVFNADTGAYVDQWGSFGTDDGEFDSPFGIDTSQNKYVYVADTGNDRIQKFTIDGDFVSKWNEASEPGDVLNAPIDVAVDPINNNVWVADRGNKRVVKYDADGIFQFEVNPTTTCPMDALRGISVDIEGNAYISDQTDLTTNPNNQGVYKITPSGKIVGQASPIITSAQKKFILDDSNQAYWVNQAGNLRRGPGKPKLLSRASTMQSSSSGQSIAIAPDKSIYFLESAGTTISRIKKFNPASNLSKTIGSYGTGNGQTDNAKGIALSRYGAKDAIEIIADVIDYSNTENEGGFIDPPTTWDPAENIFIQPGSLGGYRTISSLIEEFNNSYEWRLDPDFYIDSGNIKLGKMHMGPTIGENKYLSDSILFEYGFGKYNVNDYTIKKSIENMANKLNYPAADQVPYNVGVSVPDLIEKIGVFEDVVNGELISKNLRKALLDLHLIYRSSPRTLVEITPARSDQSGPEDPRTPIPLLEYHLGDIIGIGIKEEGEYRIDPVEARIYDISIQIDSEGLETATLNLYFTA